MAKKRPYASEGHLRLPAEPAAARSEAGGARTVEVLGDELAAFHIRAGDRVVLVRRPVDHGDVVALRDDADCLRLWKAYPESESISLRNATGRQGVAPDTAFEGVVVAVVRRFRS
jgi:hypothetical protein